MANAKILRWGPKATYIPLTRVGIFALGDPKVLSFALGDAKVPNANGFASQWNIGFTYMDPGYYRIMGTNTHFGREFFPHNVFA